MRPGRLRDARLAALAAGFACAVAAAAPTLDVADDLGRTVSLARPAERVLTLAPHATEMVFAAGGGERIVGTVRYSDHPPAARDIPRVGDAWQLSAEATLAQRPDLVVAWQPGPIAGIANALAAARVPVFFAQPTTLAGIPDDVERLGALLGTEEAARHAAGELRRRIAGLEAGYAHRAPMTVFVHAGSDPLYTLTDAHVVGDALRLCGARNLYGDAAMPAPMVDLEAVMAASPDVIVTATMAGENPIDWWRRQAPSLPAVAQGRFVVIDGDLLYRPGPRLVEATELLCERIDAFRP